MDAEEIRIQNQKMVIPRHCNHHALQRNMQVGSQAFGKPAWIVTLPLCLQESSQPGQGEVH